MVNDAYKHGTYERFWCKSLCVMSHKMDGRMTASLSVCPSVPQGQLHLHQHKNIEFNYNSIYHPANFEPNQLINIRMHANVKVGCFFLT